MTDQDTVVIGAGILGLAVARAVLLRHPGSSVLIVEKESGVARHQTAHNSGVIHAGEAYKPGSEKAALCVTGARQLVDFCRRHAIPVEVSGKLIVAVEETDLAGLDELERRALANGVAGVRRLPGTDISTVEPHAVGISALHLPSTGVTDFAAVARSLLAESISLGASAEFGFRVARVASRPSGGVRLVRADGEVVTCRRAVVCAGAQSDRLARSADLRIVPFRGSYLRLRARAASLVRSMIYPVPDPRFPFLGVHFTRHIDGHVSCGPNAVLGFARERYQRVAFDRRDAIDALAFSGSWRLARRHWRSGCQEVLNDLSLERYVRRAQRYLPELCREDLERGDTGVRAQAVTRDGRFVDDFRFEQEGDLLHVLNAPSPAASASLAIAEQIVNRLMGLAGS